MQRTVLAVPLAEIRKHLDSNDRQDVKVVAPERLSEALYRQLIAKGKRVKEEKPLEGHIWKHSNRSQPNFLCESGDFVERDSPIVGQQSFALSLANEKADQDDHFHREHIEIYFSEHKLSAQYRCPGKKKSENVTLAKAGAIVFGPGVVHRMVLHGLTLVIEIPAVKNDKVNESVSLKADLRKS